MPLNLNFMVSTIGGQNSGRKSSYTQFLCGNWHWDCVFRGAICMQKRETVVDHIRPCNPVGLVGINGLILLSPMYDLTN